MELEQPAALTGDAAARFDGENDLVEVPDHADLNPGTLTVTAWIRPDANNAQPCRPGHEVGSPEHQRVV